MIYEKIFYTPERLDASDAPMANGPAGTLAYYEPWGNVAIFYEECKGASGLYRLGQVVSGIEFIEEISGQITLEKTDGGSAVSAITEQKAAEKPNPPNEETEQNDNQLNIELSTGSCCFTATIYNNEAARKFAAKACNINNLRTPYIPIPRRRAIAAFSSLLCCAAFLCQHIQNGFSKAFLRALDILKH